MGTIIIEHLPVIYEYDDRSARERGECEILDQSLDLAISNLW